MKSAPREKPQYQRLAVVLRLEILDKPWLAHEMGDALRGIAAPVEPKMALGHRIAPLDAVLPVEYHHAVRHGGARLPEFLEGRG